MRAAAAPADVESAALARFGEPNRRLSSRVELRFGRHGSVAVAVAGERAGAWYDHERGEGGWLAPAAGGGDGGPPREPPPRGRFVHDPAREARVRELLARCRCPLGTPAEAYLRSRAIDPPYPWSLRFCADPFGMVALAQDGGGEVRAVQVVHLTADGRKADVAVVKRTLKAGDGWQDVAAVRFPGRGGLVLCEGIETGLSAWKATGRPVWPCLGIGNMARAPVWPRRGVTLARDGDPPGSPADDALSKALAGLRARGVEVRVVIPPPGLDLNDLHRRDGPPAVAALFRGRR